MPPQLYSEIVPTPLTIGNIVWFALLIALLSRVSFIINNNLFKLEY